MKGAGLPEMPNVSSTFPSGVHWRTVWSASSVSQIVSSSAMKTPWARGNMPSPNERKKLPSQSNTIIGCSPRLKTKTLSCRSTPTPPISLNDQPGGSFAQFLHWFVGVCAAANGSHTRALPFVALSGGNPTGRGVGRPCPALSRSSSNSRLRSCSRPGRGSRRHMAPATADETLLASLGGVHVGTTDDIHAARAHMVERQEPVLTRVDLESDVIEARGFADARVGRCDTCLPHVLRKLEQHHIVVLVVDAHEANGAPEVGRTPTPRYLETQPLAIEVDRAIDIADMDANVPNPA